MYFLFIGLAIIFSLSACGPAEDTAKLHVNQATEFIQQGQYDEAIEE